MDKHWSPTGARWLRCDIHCHTPFDSTKKFGLDCRGALDASERGDDAKLRDIAFQWLNTASERADLVAITDHNTFEGYAIIKRYFNQWKANTGSLLRLLPGSELTCGAERNMHILFIAREETPLEDLRAVIGALWTKTVPIENGLPNACHVQVEAAAERIRELAEARRFEYLLVPAHITSDSGIAKETQSIPHWDETLKNQIKSRTFALRHWAGFQATGTWWSKPGVIQLLTEWALAAQGLHPSRVTPQDRELLRQRKRWPVIEGSDPPNFEKLCLRHTWMKMEAPSLEGVRQALLDPDSRLRTMSEGKPALPNSFIDGISVRGSKFLKTPFDLRFHPHLTTIIGGRGTGKSTLIELLRYGVWRDQAERDMGGDATSTANEHKRIIQGLEPEHCVMVTVFDAQREYRVQRTREGKLGEVDPRRLISPRILSQRQISEIALNPKAQRIELDELVPELEQKRWKDARENARKQVYAVYRELRALTAEVAKLPSTRTELGKIKARLALIESGGNQSIFQDFSRVEMEQVFLEEIASTVEARARELEHAASRLEASIVSGTMKVPDSELFTVLKNDIENYFSASAQVLRTMASKSRELASPADDDAYNEWKLRRANAVKEYHELESKLTEAGVGTFSASVHTELLRNREAMEKEINELESKVARIDDCKTRLVAAIVEVLATCELRLNARTGATSSLMVTDTVKVELRKQSDLSNIESLFMDQWKGTHLRNSDWEVLLDFVRSDGALPRDESCWWAIPLSQVAETMGVRWAHLALALVSDLEASASGSWKREQSYVLRLLGPAQRNQLSGNFDRAIGAAAERLKKGSFDPAGLLVEMPEDEVITTVKKGNAWQPIQKGSLGERSVGILALLMSAGENPLVIDQPEEDLDNRYVYENVVQLIRRCKFNRQIILVTHNANIPVNGDAELVLCMRTDDNNNGLIAVAGTVDQGDVKQEICDVMEGSAEAFRLRRERYGF